MYHYYGPASHLLVGPAGVWVIMPYHQNGKAEYVNNRWKLSGGGFIQSYMKIFGQESLGKPDRDAQVEIDAVKSFLSKNLDEQDVPDVKALLVFTNENVALEAGDSPIPAMKLKQLKDFLRQESKTRALNSEKISKITSLLAEH
jgi:hypothetical protein